MMIACNQVGAYVVHALPEHEREEFLRHLAGCDSCQREVAEFSETTAALASTVATTPPPDLRASVLGAAARVRPLPPLQPEQTPADAPAHRVPGARDDDASGDVVSLDERRAGRRGFLRWSLAAASVGVVGLGAAGSISGWRTASERGRDLAAQTDLLAAPDAKLIPVALRSGGRASYVVSRQQNRAMFVAEGLPPLPEGKVFQQWTIVGARPIGNVTFTSADEPVWLDGDVAGADNLAVTVENEGGATTPNVPSLLADPVEV